NYKNALADLLEKEVEEEEEIVMGLKMSIIFIWGMLLGVDLDEGDFFIKMVSSGLLFLEMDMMVLLGWLLDMAGGSNPLEKWQAKIRKIISKLDEIDKRAESVPLSTSDGTKGRRKNRIFQMHNGDHMLYEDRDLNFGTIILLPKSNGGAMWQLNTKRGAGEDRLFQITKNIGWQDGMNVAIIKDLFMSKGTFQVNDGSQTAKILLSSFEILNNGTVFMCQIIVNKIFITFGLAIGGLGDKFVNMFVIMPN
ncbi:hypothetical protein ACJX0J_018900, partial [Zea mays]